jgi:hypothetical protein
MAMTCDLTNPIFTDQEAARKHFDARRCRGGAPVSRRRAAAFALQLSSSFISTITPRYRLYPGAKIVDAVTI